MSWRAGGAPKKSESKDSVVSGARALTLLCHWGNCKTKEDDIHRHTRMQPHVKVRLKVRSQLTPSLPYHGARPGIKTALATCHPACLPTGMSQGSGMQNTRTC